MNLADKMRNLSCEVLKGKSYFKEYNICKKAIKRAAIKGDLKIDISFTGFKSDFCLIIDKLISDGFDVSILYLPKENGKVVGVAVNWEKKIKKLGAINA